ncbi:hypothetical protein [Sphingobacterium siyangense]|uniref:hypothetical protein n=1 Tax=Sphingobacterium siyangense TaxID=459529 RepID=UPI001965D30B|nr:hypothetical protein [Sphingobacterium siyangense]QRY55561.1 hypothetical protein JVX97_16095 [Sphingobacterium siyangense]
MNTTLVYRKFTLISLITFAIGCQKDTRETIPEFNVLKTESNTIFNTKDLGNGMVTILIHFDPSCKDCQEEAEDIIKHKDKLARTRIFYLSVEDTSKINLFRDFFHFSDYQNITFGRDIDTAMAKHFRTGVTPLLAVYDKDNRLQVVFEGKANMSELLGIIQKIETSKSN